MKSLDNGVVLSLPTAPARILAVDDQPDLLRVVQLRLESAGMKCFTFLDGASALNFLADELVDIIILDVMMPIMDGFEVCRRIKLDPRLQDIPVIFLTAKLDLSDCVQGLQVGGHDYLNKPVDAQELLARTQAALRVKHLQDQLKSQILLQHRVNQLQQEHLSNHWQMTLGQLAASLAHEINNPLAAALGNVQLLALDSDLTEETRRRLKVVDESLFRAGQKLRSLLLIAQNDRQNQLVSLSALVADLITLINYQALKNKVVIERYADASVQWAGPPSVLARASLYLLNNAIEAVAGKSDAKVIIRTDCDAHWQYLKIADNGPGIPEKDRGRLFETFFSTKGPPHNGFGLYLAKEAIQHMGGSIQFESPSPSGKTEFTIRLPRPVT